MLLQRILTALVLAAVAISAIFLLPILYFYLFIAVIVLIAAWEWTNLVEINKVSGKLGFLLLLIVPMLGVTFWTQLLELTSQVFEWPEIKEYSGALEWLVIGPVVFWVMMMILIRKVPEGLLAIELKTSFKVFIGWFVLLSAWMFLTKLRAYYGADAVMYFLALIWFADIAAYFTGKKFGKDKLAPAISPGKTVQGMYGAIISAMLCAVVLALYYGYPMMIATDFGMLSILTVLVSIYGDLFFSLMKRKSGVKDSGSILPGHGGVLDRIDSVIAAAPFYYAGVILIGRSVFA
ncbi:MAG: phosphatidate cytidylyltransferase [Methylococcales bacterium]|nr:phosphatidate cytidylyltransferase [Methylococcales bacterium]